MQLLDWFERKIHDWATDDEQQRNLRRSQQSLRVANRKIQRGRGFKYGKLSPQNPNYVQARQQFVQRNRVPQYNPAKITQQAIRQAFPRVALGTRDFGVDIAREIPKGVVRIANTLPQTRTGNPMIDLAINQVRNPIGFTRKDTKDRGEVLTPNNRITRDIYGKEAIVAAPQEAKEIGKSLTGKELPNWAAAPIGLAINTPAGKPVKSTVKAIAKNKAARGLAQAGGVKAPKTPTIKSFKYKTSQEYEQAVINKQKSLQQSTAQATIDKTMRELADPRRIDRKIDLQRAKILRAKGKLKGRSLTDFTGQRELTPDKQIAHLRGIAENPGTAAKDLDKVKYRAGKLEGSVEDVTKIYGKKYGAKARGFETYRVYRDELERIAGNEPNTLGIDPRGMARYVSDYNIANPNAAAHAAILRQSSLKNLAERVKAGIDDPYLLEYASKRPSYNPRRPVSPEDQVLPSVSGGVRSGAKTTKGRSATSGGESESPLDLFYVDNANTVKGLAEQRIGLIVRDMARQGEKFRGTEFKELINAETVKKHKNALREMKQVHETLTKLGKERRTVRTKTKGATAERKAAQAQSKASEERAVRLVKDRLRVISGKSEKKGETQAFSDVANEVNSLSKQSALQIFDAMARNDTKTLASALRTLNKNKGASDDMTRAVAQLKDEYQELSSGIRNVNEERIGTVNEVKETYQNLNTGEQTYSYRFEGETGKVRIPIEVAKELDSRNKALTRSLTDRGLNAAANSQKVFWTGFLAPVFKTWNVLIKNPVLAGLNAPGLSGVGLNAGKSVIKQVFQTKGSKELMKTFREKGMIYENLMQSRNIYRDSADDVASRANVISFFNRNPIKTLGDIGKGLNQVLATFDNIQRKAVAEGVYKKSLRQGYSEEQARWIGAAAPARVFGDFNRVSALARNMEALIPFTGALQSGSRALREAYRTRPGETALKTSILVGGMGALTGYSLSNAAEYYKDMKDQNKEYILDNNWVLAWPGAKKDADGKWSGILNIPLTPDLRPINKAVREAMIEMANGDLPNVAALGYEVFNTYTGDITGSIYDEVATRRADGNKIAGTFAGSAIGAAAKVAFGNDPSTLKPLADEFTAGKGRTEQATEFTSDLAKNISKVTGGFLTPLQVDAFLTRAGKTGDVLQNKEGDRLNIFGQGFLKDFQPGTSESKGAKFYDDLEDTGQEFIRSGKLKEDDFRFVQSLYAKNSVKSVEDGALRAQGLLTRPGALDFVREMDRRKRARGELADPFFGLTSDRQQRVLRYRASKDLNSAKQAYDKSGNPLFTSLGLDEKWYNGDGGYKDKEEVYFDKLGTTQKKDLKKKRGELAGLGNKNSQQAQSLKRDISRLEGNIESQILTYSGAKKPDNPAMEKLQDKYHTLTKGARSNFLDANPELLEYWAEGDKFTNAERIALGLKVGGEDSFGGTGGSQFAGGYGRRGSRGGYGNSGGYSSGGGSTSSTRTAKYVSTTPPKGVKVKKLSVPKAKTKKISVTKIKSNYLNRKLG